MTPIVYYVYAPDEILKERIAQRPGKIAENNIKNFDTIKQMFEEPQADEDFIRIDNYQAKPPAVGGLRFQFTGGV